MKALNKILSGIFFSFEIATHEAATMIKLLTFTRMLGLSFILAISLSASAAELQINGDGLLTGAKGVTIGQKTYNVTFREGSCITVFNGCDTASDFFFNDFNSSFFASDALLSQVFIDTGDPTQKFDSDHSLTFGCTKTFIGSPLCQIVTPYDVTTNPISGEFAADATLAENVGTPPPAGRVDQVYGTRVNRSFELQNYVWAVWSPVPESSTCALMLSGLGLLLFVFRHRKSAKV